MTTPSATTVSAMPDRFAIEEDGTPVLLGARCEECGTSFHGALEFCRRCTSDRLAPARLSRTGTIASYTIVVRASADWTGPVPYALAQVALPEGVTVASRVVDWEDGGDIGVGDPVEVVAVPMSTGDGEEVAVYGWRRSGSPA